MYLFKSVGWGIAWRLFFSRFAIVRELFGMNENEKTSKKGIGTKRVTTNKNHLRSGLKQRHTQETSIVSPNSQSVDQLQTHGTHNQDLMIIDDKPTHQTTLDGEEIEEFFSITNSAVKDAKKPKDAVLETFDPLNS